MTDPLRHQAFLAEASNYYSDTLRMHGATPRGADWNGEASQSLRFLELLRVLPAHAEDHAGLSLCDLGCGYGALLDHLGARTLRYTGVDVSADMIAAARTLHGETPRIAWQHGDRPSDAHDVVVASGIFNVRGDAGDAEWLDHMHRIIDVMHGASRLGFAFNCLSTRSDTDRRQAHLYYTDPSAMLTHCLARYSRHVALMHDYGLYEFTVIVRRETA